jgi:hypothetical protein
MAPTKVQETRKGCGLETRLAATLVVRFGKPKGPWSKYATHSTPNLHPQDHSFAAAGPPPIPFP